MTELYGYANGNYFSTLLPVHITGYGSYQLARIQSAEDPTGAARKKEEGKGETAVDEIADPSKQEPLIAENAPDPFGAEQTWPTKEEFKDTKVKMRTIAEEPAGKEFEEEMQSQSNESQGEEKDEEEEKDVMKDLSVHESDEDVEEDEEDTEENKISAK
jgi:hypothetical protein